MDGPGLRVPGHLSIMIDCSRLFPNIPNVRETLTHVGKDLEQSVADEALREALEYVNQNVLVIAPPNHPGFAPAAERMRNGNAGGSSLPNRESRHRRRDPRCCIPEDMDIINGHWPFLFDEWKTLTA